MNIPTFDEVMEITATINNIHVLQIDECRAMYETLCELPDGAVLAEVGCDQGRSSSIIAQIGAAKDFLTIHIDPWEEYRERAAEWMENVAKRCPWHRFIVFHMTTEVAAPHIERLIPDGIDWAFIDGAHDTPTVEGDLRIIAEKVRPGGFLLAHDYPSGGVTEAIDPYIAASAGGWVKYRQAMGLGVWKRQ